MLLEKPLLFEVALFGYCLILAHVRRAVLSNNPLKGVVEATFAAYGGGIIVPMLLGRDGIYPFPLANDLAIPFAAAGYFIVKKYKASSFIENVTGVKTLLGCCFEAARCKIMLVWLTHANNTFSPSYFSHPLLGPILCGTLGGCGGAFLAGGGIQELSKRPSWGMMSAFFVSIFFHTFVNCAGMISHRDGATICATFLIAGHVVFLRLLEAAIKSTAQKDKSQ